MDTTLIVVGTMTGGVGKTLLSTLLAQTALSLGASVSLLDADASAGTNNRIYESLKADGVPLKVIGIGLSPGSDAVRRDVYAAAKHWEGLITVCTSSQITILDLGANMLNEFARHMRDMSKLYAKRRVNIILILPFSAKVDDVDKAITALPAFIESCPQAAIVFALNQHDGPITPDNILYSTLRKCAKNFSEIILPTCAAARTDPWNRCYELGINVLTLHRIDPDEFCALLNDKQLNKPKISIGVAMAVQADVESWVEAIEKQGWIEVVRSILGSTEKNL